MLKRLNESKSDGGFVARFNLLGLVTLSVSLVLTGGLLTAGLMACLLPRDRAGNVFEATGHPGVGAAATAPAWGDLATADIQLETPEEYLGFDLQNVKPPEWQFSGLRPEQVRTLMASCGVPAGEIERALSAPLVSVVNDTTVIRPDDTLCLSLPPEARRQLYRALGRSAANHYMQWPFVYPEQTFEACFEDSQVDPAIATLVRKLLYPRGDTQCFSDFELVMQHLPGTPEKLELLKALSRQSAVLARLRVHPDTDVDKVIGYWHKGMQSQDVRPLLESMTRIPGGSTLSLLYLLPQFARQRLYTFPLNGKVGDPAMDCHWSTMNFFNSTPDDRFTNPSYTVSYLRTNCYQIAKPTLYGDIILFPNENGNAIHSAVYLADDLVFTKNGNNCAQPWMIMRLKELSARYELDSPQPLMVWRLKNS